MYAWVYDCDQSEGVLVAAVSKLSKSGACTGMMPIS
jgi:hypothetical protein